MDISLDTKFGNVWDTTTGATGTVSVTDGILHCVGNLESNYKRFFIHVDKDEIIRIEIYAKGKGTIQIADGSTKLQEVEVNCNDMQKHCLVFAIPVTYSKKWFAVLLGTTSLIANGNVYFANPIISINKMSEGTNQVYAQGHISKTSASNPVLTSGVYNNGVESLAWDDTNKQIVVTLLRKGFAKEPLIQLTAGTLGKYPVFASRFDRTTGTFNVRILDIVTNNWLTPNGTYPVDFYFQVTS